jgi:myo-inositol-1(or 4)-monophosphatase
MININKKGSGDIHYYLQLAVEAARGAVKLIFQDLSDDNREIMVDLPRDVKIKADTRSESFITEELSMKSPYPILSEENDLTKIELNDNEYCWIVDPLDGSLNYSRGIPINCISIALWKGMEPLLGVVYDFNRNEIFTGIANQGAWLNSIPIKVGTVKEKSKAVLFTGFPVGTNFSQKSLLAFVNDIKEYKKIRLLGSAAVSLAYVACGRGDCYRENDIKIWDVAAGLALVKAANGLIKYTFSKNTYTLKVEAKNHFL